MNVSDLTTQLEWRYATKQFDDQFKVPQETEDFFDQVLRLSPSSFGLQPWKFYKVKSKETRAQIAKAAFNQPQVTQASLLYVLTAKKNIGAPDIESFANSIVKQRGVKREEISDYMDMISSFINNREPSDLMNWNKRQVYISLGFLLSTAAYLGIDACPMEGFDPVSVDKILNLEDYTSVVICALGRRSQADKYANSPKVRYEKSQLIVEV